mmetsp:Transcript_16228/g.20557  ORF Transcript_16228/g.20557 Transcript_16228/m.20557 type:complete len:302 (-) Transcript_16228:130-1035(-)
METRDDNPDLRPSSRLTRQTTQSSLNTNLSKKEEALKRLNEREERLAEFKARKERENAHLRAEREMQAKAKSELIKEVQRKNEERRQQTMRKISEKDKRAELILKERENLDTTGRYRGIEMSQRLIHIMERSSFYKKKSPSHRDGSEKLVNNMEIVIEQQNIVESEGAEDDNSIEIRESDSKDDNRSLVKKTISSNIVLKSSISRMIDTPLSFMLNQLSQVQLKIVELEETVKKKNNEIKDLENKLITWQTKSFCIILGITVLMHGSGMFSQMRLRGSNNLIDCMKTLPPYLAQCFKIERR